VLICGIAAALLYVSTDLIASSLYPGFSIKDQAVSELFAIGAPPSRLVVPLFTLSSALLLAFAVGIALSARGQKELLLMAAMFAASAVVGLVLWNFFPIHMRGAERSFTDTMHLILATNPFVWVTLAIGLIAFRGWFRAASALAILMVILPAIFAFRYAPALDAGQATPGFGLWERIAQYSYQVWQIVLAIMLLGEGQAARRRTKHP
jgi:hypothetical membrane protein